MVTETREGGIALDVGQASSRYARYKRKKPAWMVGLQFGVIVVVVAGLAGLGWYLLPRTADTLTIPPITDQEITQGDELRMQIPIRRAGRNRGELTYSLDNAPHGASIDQSRGVFSWPTTSAHTPGEYEMVVKVVTTGANPMSYEQAFTVRLRPDTSLGDTGPSFGDAFNKDREPSNPFEIEGEVTPAGKIDELVFAKLKELEIEPANLCSDGGLSPAGLSRYDRHAAHRSRRRRSSSRTRTPTSAPS